METGMSTTRLVISVVIILGCFSVLYPRFFHPIILKIFGLSPPPKQNHDSVPRRPGMPPEMPKGMPDDIRSHMRPGPHPGMRAAAEMNSQQQRSGRGGGVMTTVLPMYAVGITVYLIYTLVKVFNKKGNYEKGKEERLAKSRRYSDSLLNKRTEKQMSREERVQEFVESSQKLGELEELLSRVDDKHIDDADMRELQRRLEETESQMARIMQAMQTVTNKVNSVAEDTSDKTVEENDQTKNNQRSTDSSPDISSYEVINKKSSSEVETLKAAEVPQKEETDSHTKETESQEDKKEEENVTDEVVEPAEDIMIDGQKDEEDEDEEDRNIRKRKGRVTESD